MGRGLLDTFTTYTLENVRIFASGLERLAMTRVHLETVLDSPPALLFRMEAIAAGSEGPL